MVINLDSTTTYLIGVAVGFIAMQVKQNISIKNMKQDIVAIKADNSKKTHYQIQMEKEIIKISSDMKHVLEGITELKEDRKK